MRGTMKGLILMAGLMALSACGQTGTKTASVTEYKQLSQLDWIEMTAAPTAAQVNNNSLIMMR